MSTLATERCKPCEGGTSPLDARAAERLLGDLANGWQIAGDGKILQRDFSFKNFHETMAFVNAVAWIAHRADHHPDLKVGYRHCLVDYTTHAIGGLSRNDFICAARIDALIA